MTQTPVQQYRANEEAKLRLLELIKMLDSGEIEVMEQSCTWHTSPPANFDEFVRGNAKDNGIKTESITYKYKEK